MICLLQHWQRKGDRHPTLLQRIVWAAWSPCKIQCVDVDVVLAFRLDTANRTWWKKQSRTRHLTENSAVQSTPKRKTTTLTGVRILLLGCYCCCFMACLCHNFASPGAPAWFYLFHLAITYLRYLNSVPTDRPSSTSSLGSTLLYYFHLLSEEDCFPTDVARHRPVIRIFLAFFHVNFFFFAFFSFSFFLSLSPQPTTFSRFPGGYLPTYLPT